MYRHGFGDCFLLTFRDESVEKHVLIDCGVLYRTPNEEKTMQTIALDIAAITKGQIDVVVVTHEHWDHVCGFYHAHSIFNKMNIREVWLSWTEDPKDDIASTLKSDLKGARSVIIQAAQHEKKPFGAAMGPLQGIAEFFGAQEGVNTTTVMEQCIRPLGRNKYLRPGEIHEIDGLGDVRFVVLGPPRDSNLFRSRLPGTEERYISASGGDYLKSLGAFAVGDSADPGLWEQIEAAFPFDPRQRIPPDMSPLRHLYDNQEHAWRKIDSLWRSTAAQLALRLDHDTNNSSLVLAVELERSKKVLLFVGDAQFGNWISWANVKFDADKVLGSNELLRRTILYKAGHHGSHNGTLRSSAALMTSPELIVLVPVCEEAAKRVGWGKIPYAPLITALGQQSAGRLIRSDRGASIDVKSSIEKNGSAAVEENDLWLDVSFAF
jgi:hypothetical protein